MILTTTSTLYQPHSGDGASRPLFVGKMMPDDLLSSYMFTLPPERIAQRPAPERDGSRFIIRHPEAADVKAASTLVLRHVYSFAPVFLFYQSAAIALLSAPSSWDSSPLTSMRIA